MSSLLNIGASGLLAQNTQLNAIGNNIANSGTTGYKASSVSFAESFYNIKGREANGILNQSGQGVQVAGMQSNWTTGASTETGIATNLTIIGNGFFPVQLGGSTYYTRNGSFSWTDYSQLSGGAQTGYAMTLSNGAALTDISETVLLFDAIPTSLVISPDGTITATDANLTQGSGNLGLMVFSNPDGLERIEAGLFAGSAAAGPLTAAPVTPGSQSSGGLRQGELEMSNVDLVTEFTSLITAQRAFQANSRTITTADELLQEIVNLKR